MPRSFQARPRQSGDRLNRCQGPTQDSQCTLALRNRQRVRPVDLRFLRRIAQTLMRQTWPSGTLDLAIYVVGEPEITKLNETFLRHKGSTDVIAFDYADRAGSGHAWGSQDACPAQLHGEIFVCADEAVSQARRFHTTWQNELVRYIVHGMLHLLGHDDLERGARRRMRAEEDRLLSRLASQFDLRRLNAARSK
jgi:probable rRNA maturation factor